MNRSTLLGGAAPLSVGKSQTNSSFFDLRNKRTDVMNLDSATPERRLEVLDQSGHRTVAELSVTAFNRLQNNLEGYGNVLSARHCEALMAVVGIFSYLANGMKEGRYAIPLDTGCGKSQAVVAWCAAVHELGLPYSVAIAANKVEALAEMKRNLIKNGVHPDKIGLWHGYEYDPSKVDDVKHGKAPGYATEPATTHHETKQFLLVTHNRIKGQSDIELLNRYKPAGEDARTRDLFIWDESLLSSTAKTIDKLDLKTGLAWFKEKIAELDDIRAASSRAHARKSDLSKARARCPDAADYLDRCVRLLDDEFTAQATVGRGPVPVNLPDIDTATLGEYTAAVSSFPNFHVEPLVDLLAFCQNPVRVVRAGKATAFITYAITLSKELKRIAILDASWPIRTLEKMDSTIREVPGFPRDVKRYSKVTIHQLEGWSGRGSVEESFKKKDPNDRKISQEVCHVVKNIPLDHGVILFTFKTKPKKEPVDVEAILRKDLEATGVDLNATVLDHKGNPRPRIVILRWGQETSLSEFSYCRHVVFAGVLYRAILDLIGEAIGQLDDLLADVNGKATELQLSEVAHVMYQAMSRGSCRNVVDGEADPMDAWFIYPNDDLRGQLSEVMPGATWVDWPAQFMRAMTTVIKDTAEKIVEYLNGLLPEVTRLSTSSIKKILGLTEMPKMTFTLAVQAVTEMAPWRITGRSLERLPFEEEI